MRPPALLAFGLFVGLLAAAPVPKEKEKTAEQKLIGKWRLGLSDGTASTVLTDGEFSITFKEKGEVEVRYESDGGKRVVSHVGTYTVTGDTKLEYTVDQNGEKKTETLTIDKLTESDVWWTDASKQEHRLVRVKEEKKDEPKKDK